MIVETLEIRRDLEGNPNEERVLLLDHTGLTVSPNAGLHGLLRDDYTMVTHRIESKLSDAYIFTVPLGTWIVRHFSVICETVGAANATITIKACQIQGDGIQNIATAPSQLIAPLVLQGTTNVVLFGEIVSNPLPLKALENFAIAYTGVTTGLSGLLTLILQRLED